MIKNRCRQIREQGFLYEGKKRHEPWPQERLDRQEGLTAAVVVGRDIWGDDFQEIEQE